MPHVVAIAGPNGAGKSTNAPATLRDRLGVAEFVNADVLARAIAPLNPERVAARAGRMMLEILDDLAAAGGDFALETTLSGMAYRRRFAEWKVMGYDLLMVYFWLDSADLSPTAWPTGSGGAATRSRRRTSAGVGGAGWPTSSATTGRSPTSGTFMITVRKPARSWWRRGPRAARRCTGHAHGRPVMAQTLPKPSSLFSDGKALESLMQKATRRLLREHKQLGYPIVVSHGGTVTWIAPEDINVTKPDDTPPAPEA